MWENFVLQKDIAYWNKIYSYMIVFPTHLYDSDNTITRNCYNLSGKIAAIDAKFIHETVITIIFVC